MTPRRHTPLRDPALFYDRVAPDYDLMTGFDDRFDRERPWFQDILVRYDIATALDAGCGTGFHSILLSQLGVRMAAADVSGEMVSRTQANAEKYGVEFPAVRSGFQELHRHFREGFDAVFCLGNSLVHVLSDRELLRALGNFAAVLRPSGTLFVQVLNYERILRARKEILNEKSSGGSTFTRSYQYGGETITFTVEIGPAEKDTPGEVRTHSVSIRPVFTVGMKKALEETGFTDIREYGSLRLDPFDAGSSADLVMVARRVTPEGN